MKWNELSSEENSVLTEATREQGTVEEQQKGYFYFFSCYVTVQSRTGLGVYHNLIFTAAKGGFVEKNCSPNFFLQQIVFFLLFL